MQTGSFVSWLAFLRYRIKDRSGAAKNLSDWKRLPDARTILCTEIKGFAWLKPATWQGQTIQGPKNR